MSHISVFEDDLREQYERDRRKARRLSWMTPAPKATDISTRNTSRRKRRRSENSADTPSNPADPPPQPPGATPSLFPFFNGGFRTPRCRFFQAQSEAAASRRIQFQPDLAAGIELEEDADREKESALCGRVWHVHRLSPLFGISSASKRADGSDAVQCNTSRDRVIAAFKTELGKLLEEQHRGVLDQAKSKETRDALFQVTVDGNHGIRGTQHDADGIMVEVKRGSKSVFTAHMLSVDCQEELQLEETSDYAILPVLLTSSTTGLIAKTVLGVVERFFDAVIGKMFVSQLDLKWMLAAWVRLGSGEDEEEPAESEEGNDGEEGRLRRKKDARVVATYELPQPGAKGLKSMTVALKQGQLVKLWGSIHDAKETFATDMEVKLFHSALSKFIGSKFGVQCSRLRLSSIELPIVSVNHAGKVKIHDVGHAHTVLCFFTDLCQLKLESAAPGIACSSSSVGTIGDM